MLITESREIDDLGEGARGPWPVLLAVLPLLLVLGYLLFCHGCHRDDVDDEVWGPKVKAPQHAAARPCPIYHVPHSRMGNSHHNRLRQELDAALVFETRRKVLLDGLDLGVVFPVEATDSHYASLTHVKHIRL